MSDYENIRLEIEGAIAILTLDRPKKLNAFDVATLVECLRAVERIHNDDEVRVAILTGAGRSFSAGADLTSRLAPGRTTFDHLNNDYRPVLMAITQGPKPWISAVNGAAAGIGSAFAMNCDLTVMAEDAYLYQAFGSIGLIPDGGASWHLARTIGKKRAYELMVTGEKLTAERCLELGLCNRVVPSERLMEESRAWAEELARKAPLSMRYAKAALQTAMDDDLNATFTREAELQMRCFESEDTREGFRAFSEKRDPSFKGR